MEIKQVTEAFYYVYPASHVEIIRGKALTAAPLMLCCSLDLDIASLPILLAAMKVNPLLTRPTLNVGQLFHVMMSQFVTLLHTTG